MVNRNFLTPMSGLPIKEKRQREYEEAKASHWYSNNSIPMGHVHLIQDRALNHLVRNNMYNTY